ncbi:LANO_0D03774g1_1 [Lachancea nothofagi CBS 11611]|uniref:Kynurenine formamidase n=1 Tax=Lachancea nothofagi CBS 11611 TaxID=1266666 RepID=A0A1G4JFQ6_9SACH|nr:LANO_0D03774g1_1 [Lachancea nothofagi CBS 11611]
MAKFDQTVTFRKAEVPGPHRAIVFIHGGAWIDPSNTPHDFDQLSKHLLDISNSQLPFSLYAVEYRLSPEYQHPIHIQDVIDNLAQLIQQEQIDELNLLGHSVGATLCWQILSLDSSIDFVEPSQLQLVRSKLKRCYLTDGIYSLKELLKEYPSYDYFVSKAFSKVDDYDDPRGSEIDSSLSPVIYVIHSYQDELLSLRQSNYFCAVLQELQQPYQVYLDDLGKHNDVYENLKLAQYVLYTMMR